MKYWLTGLMLSVALVCGAAQSGDFEYVVPTRKPETAVLTAYHGTGGDVIIPARLEGLTITGFTREVFGGNVTLTSIDIPATITAFPAEAFRGCSQLQRVVIQEGVKRLSTQMFADCSALTDILLPASLQSIGTEAFQSCTALKSFTVPAGVANLSSRIFEGATNLVSISFLGARPLAARDTLPKLSATYPSGDVTWCPTNGPTHLALATCTVRDDSNWAVATATSGGVALRVSYSPDVKNTLRVVAVPATFQGQPVVAIADNGFSDCPNLEWVQLPPSVTRIGDNAFENCPKLKTVLLPQSVIQIGLMAFKGCPALETCAIPRGIQAIPYSCFEGATALRRLELPTTLAEIHARAFVGTRIFKDLVITGALKRIDSEAFKGCTSITSVTFRDVKPQIGTDAFAELSAEVSATYRSGDFTWSANGIDTVNVGGLMVRAVTPDTYFKTQAVEGGVAIVAAKSGDTSLAAIIVPGVLAGHPVVAIADEAFAETPLVAVRLPDTVKTIGAAAFGACRSLRQINIPTHLTSLGESAFNGCEALPAIELPATVTQIGAAAFAGCTSLRTAKIHAPCLNLPDSTFERCTSLEEATLPASIKRIGVKAFYDCHKLHAIELPGNLQVVRPYAFTRCAALTKLLFPVNTLRIERDAFTLCTGLDTLTFTCNRPEFVETPFSCVSVAHATYPANDRSWNTENKPSPQPFGTATAVGYGTWFETTPTDGGIAVALKPEYRATVKALPIPDTIGGQRIVALAEQAFSGCDTLASVRLPRYLTTIKAKAFAKCTTLPGITIPTSVMTIADHAFTGASNLQEITFHGEKPLFGEDPFDHAIRGYTLPAAPSWKKALLPPYLTTSILTLPPWVTSQITRLDVQSRFPAWATRYAYTLSEERQDQFLMNIAPEATPGLQIDSLTTTAQGATISITALANSHPIDLALINGTLQLESTESLSKTFTTQPTLITNITAQGTARATITSPYIKAVIR